jgi:hypothetical protein
MSQPGIAGFFKAKNPDDPSSFILSQPAAPATPAALAGPNDNKSFEEVLCDREARRLHLVSMWQLPARKPRNKRGRGSPSYQAKWIEGLHMFAISVSVNPVKTKQPATHLIVLDIPTGVGKTGFTGGDVLRYFEGKTTQAEFEATDLAETEGAGDTGVALETAIGAGAEAEVAEASSGSSCG